MRTLNKFIGTELVTVSELGDIISNGLVKPFQSFVVTDAQDGKILLFANDGGNIDPQAVNQTTGEWGTYDVGTDVFTAQGGDNTVAIQAVIVGDFNATIGDVEYGIPIPFPFYLTTYRVYAQDAPSGGTTILDLKKNGVSVTSSGAEISSGNNFSTTPPVITTNTFAADDIAMPSFTSVASTPGKRYTITLIGYKL
ncbi:MAG TPA: hypothetical protein VIK77_00245 [Tissierellaceae bacterium]